MLIPTTVLTLAAIGLVAGMAGGMMGIGGSLVMIPAMDLFLGPDQHLYQAAAMIVNFFVAAPAVHQHRRAGAIDLPTVGRLLPLAIVAIVGGVALSEHGLFTGGHSVRLRGLFGVFLLAVCVADALRLFRPRTSAGTPAPGAEDVGFGPATLSWSRAALVAVPTGLVAGLLGVGGGVVAVPLQRKLLRLPLRTAIANSAAVIVATSVIGAAAKNYAYIVDHGDGLRPLALSVCLIPLAIVGSTIGSRLTHRIPIAWVKLGFATVLVLAAVRLIYPAVVHTLG